jgi:hypothetical protein
MGRGEDSVRLDLWVHLEILLKKAAIDPAFRESLIRDASAAAESIGLPLKETEVNIFSATTAEKWAWMIEEIRAKVKPEEAKILRRMRGPELVDAMVALDPAGRRPPPSRVTGIRPDWPGKSIVSWSFPLVPVVALLIILVLLVCLVLRWQGIL